MLKIDKVQIENDIRAEIENKSESGVYVVYLGNDSGSSLVTLKGDLDSAILNFFEQIGEDDLVNESYSSVNIRTIEEFSAISSHIN